MAASLRPHHVDQVRVSLSYGAVLDGPAHDVFLLQLRPRRVEDVFDEVPYLELLEPVLHQHGAAPDPCVLQVTRTHRSWTGSPGEAEIALTLSTGRARPVGNGQAAVARDAMRSLLQWGGDGQAGPLRRRDALSAARELVRRAYPEARHDTLLVTDEEHLASAGMWSIGLAVPGAPARFGAVLGFVDGHPRTAHLRRMPGSEVVDSVGT